MISWLKLDIAILDDEKIRLIRKHPDGNALFVLWVGLLCLAMKSNRAGYIEVSNGIPYSVEDLAMLFDIEHKTVQLGLVLFQKYRMVDVFEGGAIEVINFMRHQAIDKIQHQRELTRERVKRLREKQKCNALLTRNTVTSNATDIDIDKEKNTKVSDSSSDLPDNGIPYRGIVDFLNQKAGKQYRYTTKATKRLIHARWNEGFRLKDFLSVIEGRCDKWLNDPNMMDYLRPETLFGTKFESYLNAE